MKLHTSMTSPFGHKCRLVVRAAGLENDVEIVAADNKSEAFKKLNPLSKVPALEVEGERVVINSPVIAAYLADRGKGTALYPTAKNEKWNALHMEALADGITEAGVLNFFEGMRDAAEISQGWIEKQLGKINTGLDVFEAEASEYGDATHIGMISLASALVWFDLRNMAGDWRTNRPNLTAWLERFMKNDFWID